MNTERPPSEEYAYEIEESTILEVLNAREIRKERTVPFPRQIWELVGYKRATKGATNLVTNWFEDTGPQGEDWDEDIRPVLVSNSDLPPNRYVELGKKHYTLSDEGAENHLQTRVPEDAGLADQFGHDEFVFFIAYNDMIDQSGESAIFLLSQTRLAAYCEQIKWRTSLEIGDAYAEFSPDSDRDQWMIGLRRLGNFLSTRIPIGDTGLIWRRVDMLFHMKLVDTLIERQLPYELD